jgi:hypothetical protein
MSPHSTQYLDSHALSPIYNWGGRLFLILKDIFFQFFKPKINLLVFSGSHHLYLSTQHQVVRAKFCLLVHISV